MDNHSARTNRILFLGLVVLVIINLGIFALAGLPRLRKMVLPASSGAHTQAPASVANESPTPASLELVEATQTPQTASTAPATALDALQKDGVVILAMRDGAFSHLFAYHPLHLPLTRLTDSACDDITPALNPDGNRLAFSSRRNGYWNLYLLDLHSGALSRITDSPEYDAAPSWSPDGQWLVYESYNGEDIDLYVRSIAGPEEEPIRLTDSPGSDTSPSWSPAGREIAFVSTRSGDMDIWIARLDQTDDRFTNVSHNAEAQDNHPAWSPDGRYLAWSSERSGVSHLMIWDSQNPNRPAVRAGSGNWPVWSPDGRLLLTGVHLPNGSALEVYAPADNAPLYPLTPLPGRIEGLDWKGGQLPALITALALPGNATQPAEKLWQPALSLDPMPPGGRFGIVPLNDVVAPYPYLHDGVDESFNRLRLQVGIETGWDLLSSLENAYLPLTEPPSPGAEMNWLLTGRAIAINPMPIYAGWMVMVKEEYDGQVFWRVYLKARYQDGSQGRPLAQMPWDINARYTGDPVSYEKGGRPGAIPGGYWIDFTEIASRYDWERLPALANWRTYYPATRFNQFVLSEGLDWNSAMAEVFPPEALITATFVPTFTLTITPTPAFKNRYTPTPPAPPTLTATIRPTWTPAP